EIATAHLFLAASASQAARAFFTSDVVRHGLVRISVPPTELTKIELDLFRFVHGISDRRKGYGPKIYGFGRLGQGWVGVIIRVISCIMTHDPGMSTPEFNSTTIVIRSAGR